MKTEELNQYTIKDEKLSSDLGVGVVTRYQLNNGASYLIMGEYHNKGALSPTVGARFKSTQSLHDVLSDAFARKRLGAVAFDGGDIDEQHIYYSINESQNMSRVTFIQNIVCDLSEEEFNQQVVVPMDMEAQHQGSVSSFFWKLEETLKNSRFKFSSLEERAQAAKNALEHMSQAKFPVAQPILDQLALLQDEHYSWNEAVQPLKFYAAHGGRKYSELTRFYLMPVSAILHQFMEPKIKSAKGDQDKQSIYIEHNCLPSQDKWKKFFIFEDEIITLAQLIPQLNRRIKTPNETSNPAFFKPGSSVAVNNLVSPWSSREIGLDYFARLNTEDDIIRNRVDEKNVAKRSVINLDDPGKPIITGSVTEPIYSSTTTTVHFFQGGVDDVLAAIRAKAGVTNTTPNSNKPG